MIIAPIMMFEKALIAGIAIAAILGMAGILLIGNAGGLIDDANDPVSWRGRGGGGCGGGRSGVYDSDDVPACHQRYSDNNSSYCPHHDEYFSEAEWLEHSDDCHYYNNNQPTKN